MHPPACYVTRVSYEHVWSTTVYARSVCIGALLDDQLFLPGVQILSCNRIFTQLRWTAAAAEQHQIMVACIS